MSEQTNDTNKNKTKNIEKTQVADIDRSIYDIRNDGADDYRFDAGLSAEIVERLSREKNDPDWMREFRLRSLEIYNRLEVPDWGPDISGLDMDHIATYVRPKNNKMQNKWEDVPEEIRDTFTQLGIPQGGAQVSGRRRRPVRLRACLPQCPQGSGGTGRRLHGF